ncbi:MAG TPA: SDR family oxidoreductase [Polyangiaceae bacterium]|jgi:short-subunit dehydrogenase|nr:SDR family oxidoreductase [Polyangiaceae bacterium]
MAISLRPLNEQVMVITGASSGIGLATALAAADAGANVVIAARSADVLSRIVRELGAKGKRAVAVECDVSDAAAVEHVAEVAIREYGRIDTWVNNAGVSIYGRLDEVSLEDQRRLFDVNFWGVVHGSLTALRYLKQGHGGALINVGSEVSEAVAPLQGTYSASKHAVKGFTDALRVEIEEVDKAPIAITLIQPTAVDTPYPEHAKNYLHREPKLPDPMIDPERVAAAILHAATQWTRDKKVGAMATVNTLTAKFMPGIADKLSAKKVEAQQRDTPPQRDPEGALYRPSDDGRVRGARAPAPASR